jgi:hypothetical protein
MDLRQDFVERTFVLSSPRFGAGWGREGDVVEGDVVEGDVVGHSRRRNCPTTPPSPKTCAGPTRHCPTTPPSPKTRAGPTRQDSPDVA